MYVSLYRRYRPQSFSEMVGQSASVAVLRESLREGRLGHAYLFSGPRGCGKTSAARLVAKALNCLDPRDDGESCGVCSACVSIAAGEHLDVLEIDGASNRGIGEIRDLKSHVNLKPLSSKFKVYIIDEVHMLTEAAFNALLKTLEEPPSNVVFLLATTEPHKIPVTIRSRCQHIPFHRISIAEMVGRLNHVAQLEKISADAEAVWELARQADGALRDALSLFEQAVSLGRGSLTMESVISLTGGSNRSELEKWVKNLRSEPERAAADLTRMLSRGISTERLTESLFALFRDMWLFLLWGEKGVGAIENSESELTFLKEESQHWDAVKAREICSFLSRLLPRARYGMRLEVYSGMVMLEVMDILEGAQVRPAAERKTAPHLQPRHMARAPQKTAPPAIESMPEMGSPVFEDDFAPPVAAATGKKETAQPPAADLSAALGGGDFARLLSAIAGKPLVFGAALLHTPIYAECQEDGISVWRLDFGEKLSPAESFLSAPHNKRTLSEAIHSVWGVGGGQKESPAAEKLEFDLTAPTAEPGRQAQQPGRKEKNDSAPSGADSELMLKLMGAEVLYQKSLQEDENGEERAE